MLETRRIEGRAQSRRLLAAVAIGFVLWGAPPSLSAQEIEAREDLGRTDEIDLGDEPEPTQQGKPADELETAPPELAADDESLAPIPPDSDIEEIEVIGERTSEKWEMGPDSFVSFAKSELQAERIADIQDIQQFTPNLEIKTVFAASNPVLFIRGVGLDDFNANSTSAVAVYQDGIYMNAPAGQLFQFFDTESVQVLRGPHGGPYRNASAGAILVNSTRPSFEPEGYGSFTYGNYDLLEGEGAVAGPLPFTNDHLAGRLSFKVTERDGWTKNRCARRELETTPAANGRCKALLRPEVNLGSPQIVPDPVNDASQWALRGQLLAADLSLGPTVMEWLLNGHGGRNDGMSYQYQHRGFRRLRPSDELKQPGNDRSGYRDEDDDPFAGDYNVAGQEYLDVAGAILRGNWELSETHQLISISGYEWHDREVTENTDAGPGNLLASRYTDESWQFTTDLRFESHWGFGLETVVGGYFIMEDLTAFNEFDQPLGLQNAGLLLVQDMEQKTRGFSFFSDVSWEFLPGLTVHGDVRYNEEYKEMTNTSVALQGTNPLGAGILSDRASDTWRGFSGSASLTYEIGEWGSIYAKYSRGYKPGHFNGGAVLSQQLIDPVDPETVDAYEVGGDAELFDGRLGLRAAFFYYDYQNQQIFQLEQDKDGGFPLPQLINAQCSEIYGVEADLTARPIEGLDIKYSVAFLESEYCEFTNSFQERIPTGPGLPPQFRDTVLDYTGNRMIGSPVWSMAGAVQYTFYLGNLIRGWEAGELVPRFSFSYKDKAYFDPGEGTGARGDLPADTIAQESFWLLNANLTWRIPVGRTELELVGWVRNLTDEEYLVQSFDVSDPAFGFVLDAYGDPRTYGLTLRATF